MKKPGSGPSRREVVVTIGASALAVPLASSGCAFLRGGAKHPILKPPVSEIRGGRLEVRFDKASALARGAAVRVKLDKPYSDFLVVQTAKGELVAVSEACTHWGCTVGWSREKSQWICPCHGSRFATDGKVLEGPAKKPLKRLKVVSTGAGRVEIDLSALKKS